LELIKKEISMKSLKRRIHCLILLLFILHQNILFAQCWDKVSASSSHQLAIQNDGTLWGWGSSSDLGIGLPSIPYYITPIQIGTQNNWADISAGENFSLGIKNDGSLWAWGSFPDPAIGGNNTTNLNTYYPVQIGNDYDWIEVSAGGQHALGLKSNNTLWAWGLNNTGQVGNGLSTCTFCPPIYQTTPLQIGSDNDWKQISAGANFSGAIKFNGTLWCWGDNTANFVNNGLPLNNTPIQIGTDTSWSQLDFGNYSHLLALKTDGTIWSWGYDITTDTPFVVIPIPSQIGTNNYWTDISAGADHDLAIKNDGTVWSWGRNYIGQMGNGNVGGVQTLPQMILSSINNNFIKISGGMEFSSGIKSDGTLWAWGSNGLGQMGIGNNLNQATPQTVNCTTLAIFEAPKNFEATLFPNPTSGLLFLVAAQEYVDSDFQIYNLLGEVISEGRISENTTIDLSHNSKGLYFLRIGDMFNQTFKIVLE
jgi:alpha-tubulin suppressor-like RCC1 family protein